MTASFRRSGGCPPDVGGGDGGQRYIRNKKFSVAPKVSVVVKVREKGEGGEGGSRGRGARRGGCAVCGAGGPQGVGAEFVSVARRAEPRRGYPPWYRVAQAARVRDRTRCVGDEGEADAEVYGGPRTFGRRCAGGRCAGAFCVGRIAHGGAHHGCGLRWQTGPRTSRQRGEGRAHTQGHEHSHCLTTTERDGAAGAGEAVDNRGGATRSSKLERAAYGTGDAGCGMGVQGAFSRSTILYGRGRQGGSRRRWFGRTGGAPEGKAGDQHSSAACFSARGRFDVGGGSVGQRKERQFGFSIRGDGRGVRGGEGGCEGRHAGRLLAAQHAEGCCAGDRAVERGVARRAARSAAAPEHCDDDALPPLYVQATAGQGDSTGSLPAVLNGAKVMRVCCLGECLVRGMAVQRT